MKEIHSLKIKSNSKSLAMKSYGNYSIVAQDARLI